MFMWIYFLIRRALIIDRAFAPNEFKAPAKRSQHLNATYPNFVGPAFACTGQTIATFERNRSQHLDATDRNIVGRNMLHAFGHAVATCCDMLRVENRTSAHAQAKHCCTNLAKRLQHHATSTNVAWKIWPFSNLSGNNTQHVPTGWPKARNMLHPIMLRYVALKYSVVWPGLNPCFVKRRFDVNEENSNCRHGY